MVTSRISSMRVTSSDMADDGSANLTKSYQADADSALADMRSSAKWLVGTLATTGAVIFAGLQLTSLKDINTGRDGWRLPVALVGFGLAVAGIIGALAAIGQFLRRFPVTAKELATSRDRSFARARESVENDPTILGEFRTFGELWDAYNRAVETIGTSSDEDDRKRLQENSAVMLRIMHRALIRAGLVLTSLRYRDALALAGIGAITAAIGGGAFAVAVAQPHAQVATLPTLVRPATQVSVAIAPHSPHRADLASALGPKCDLNKLLAVVLEQENADTFKVAFLASQYCRSAVSVLGPDDAVVSLPG